MHVFEPVSVFVGAILKRFVANELIEVHRLAAGGHDEYLNVTVDADVSSMYIGEGESLRIEICDFCSWCNKSGVEQIDLLKINIEGGEYELLEHLIASGFIANVRFVQVQFHDFVPDANVRIKRIKTHLAVSHSLDYCYGLIWESWTRKV